ncbi:glycosyltransferase family 2 protein [Shewanella sp. 6_MG-2023]|uniref:glycosyltransferase family 2 protein n=1 Tax=Shewanella sp. 6_MG-2023 TaxID=3062660 RepID=UPI0026E49025|nr:glycosyltransferase family 2 protein [Shewanella sp. 6_MG-2023]MDO6617655.1 glycosyltransferase family 2 protein [Shewanella sp. 6_MG-2023]
MIGAIIVVFNPEHSMVERLLTRVYGQVEQVIIIDNSPHENSFNSIIEHYEYIHFPDNVGIAAAHNHGLATLLASGFEYGLLLDQDSLIPEDMVFRLSSLLVASKAMTQNIAAIGPSIKCSFNNRSIRAKYQKDIFDYDELVGANQIIASGMLIDLGYLDEIGYKDESLFIDGVDHEWCWRARSKGLVIARAKKVEMVHRLGDSRSKFIGVTYRVGSPIRLYYQFRNILILIRRPYVPFYWKVRCLGLMPFKFLLNSIMQNDKKERCSYMLKGIVDGVKGNKYCHDEHWNPKKVG